jgi:hypothetical protein
MKIAFQKISNDQHRLTIERADGSSETSVLETKSLLLHDFIHLAIELEAGLQGSFWGLVASGHSFSALAGKDEMQSKPIDRTEVAITEIVVGAFTGMLQRSVPAEFVMDGIKNVCEATDRPYPIYLTQEFVERATERLRHIRGAWNATAFGDMFTIEWPEPAGSATLSL